MAWGFLDLLWAIDCNGSADGYEIVIMGHWNVGQPFDKCRLFKIVTLRFQCYERMLQKSYTYLCNQKWLRFLHGVMIEALVFVTFLYRRAMNRLFTSTQTFWMSNGEDTMSVAVAADFGFAIVMTKLRCLNILTLLSCDYSCQSNFFSFWLL